MLQMDLHCLLIRLPPTESRWEIRGQAAFLPRIRLLCSSLLLRHLRQAHPWLDCPPVTVARHTFQLATMHLHRLK